MKVSIDLSILIEITESLSELRALSNGSNVDEFFLCRAKIDELCEMCLEKLRDL